MKTGQAPVRPGDAGLATAASWLSCALVCGAIVIAPLALGATGAWSRLAVEAVLALTTVAWCAVARPTLGQLLIPCGALGIAAVQLVPLSPSLVVKVAPISAGAWLVANSETGGSGVRISIDPGATVLSAARLFLGIAATLAMAAVARDRSRRNAFCAAMAISGALIWSLGVAFPATTSGRSALGFVSLAGPITDWVDPRLAPIQTTGCSHGEPVEAGAVRYTFESGTPGDGCGSYISSNQFAGGMCLTCPFVFAAWLALTRRRLPAILRHVVMLALLAGALATTGMLARSRAGTASLLLAGLVLWMLSVERRWLKWTARTLVIAYAISLAGFGLVLYSGRAEFIDALPGRFTAPLAAAAHDARGMATRLAGRMFLASPLAGVGLGCYGPVFTRMVPGNPRFHYAHNDYAQFLAETGLLGLAYAAVLGVLVLWRIRRTRRGEPGEGRGPFDAAPWAALAGIAAHSGFDWNLHLPANVLLASVAAGLALPAAGAARSTRRPLPPWATRGLRGLRGLVAAITVGVGGLMLRDAVSEGVQRSLRDAIVADRLQRKDPSTPDPAPALAASIDAAEAMARFDPGNPRLALLLGQATLHSSARAEGEADRKRRRQSADDWFRRARMRRAFCVGLPE